MMKKFRKDLGYILLTLLVASIIIFFLVEIMPGDVAQKILGRASTPEALAGLREHLGLNKPAYVRYLVWLSHFVRGDFGESLYMTGVKIAPLILRRSLNSIVLAGFGLIMLVPVSLIGGIIAGLNKGKWIDNIISVSGLLLLSLPSFVTGIILILIFSLSLRTLPPTSNIPLGETIFSSMEKIILPALSGTLGMVGYIVRMMRSSMIQELESNYVRTAILKGLPSNYVTFKHVIRNALLPSITVIGMNIGWMFGGLIVVETLFAYPGIGYLMFIAIQRRDIPLIEATAMIITLVYMVSSVTTDLLYSFLNPRIRYSEN
jgi:peptide/nickel transport system permease protein